MSALRAFSVPLERPLRTARGAIEAREGVLVRVGAGEVTGVGEAAPLPGWTEPVDECRRALERTLDRIDGGTDEGATLASLGDAPAARHGLSLALADRDARQAGRPLYRALGGDGRTTAVPVNATIGDGSVDEAVAAARDAVGAGFDCLKLKVGARSVGGDLDRLAGVRDAIGANVELRADANGAWSREQARRALDGMAALDVAYVEQPLAPDDLDGHAVLRGDVGIALDESLATVGPRDALAAGAADVFVLKPMILGGVDRARTAAERVLDAGATPVVTTTVDAVVARTAAVHLAASLPAPPACGLATANRLGRDLCPDPAPVSDGSIRVPQGNGHGAGAAWEA